MSNVRLHNVASESPAALKAALYGAVGTFLGAVVGAAAALGGSYFQLKRETVIQCEARTEKQVEVVRTRAEAFAVALSDQISFFRENNEFEVREARRKLGEVQKAAFALSVYAGPELSKSSLLLVGAIDSAVNPSSPQRGAAIQNLFASAQAWHPMLQAELSSLKSQRAGCGGAT
jgi:hypothetical protein